MEGAGKTFFAHQEGERRWGRRKIFDGAGGKRRGYGSVVESLAGGGFKGDGSVRGEWGANNLKGEELAPQMGRGSAVLVGEVSEVVQPGNCIQNPDASRIQQK